MDTGMGQEVSSERVITHVETQGGIKRSPLLRGGEQRRY
jgi:hypothetical protein